MTSMPTPVNNVTLFHDLPYDLHNAILEEIYDDDRANEYIEDLKNFSLVSSRCAAIARPRLFQRLRLNFKDIETDLPLLLDFLSSDLVRTTTSELCLTNTFDDLVLPEGVLSARDVPPRIQDQIDRDTAIVSRVFGVLGSHGVSRITLEHEEQNTTNFLLANPLVPLLSNSFHFLTHLTIIKGPQIDLVPLSDISTLEYLELLIVDIEYHYFESDGTKKCLPKLKRLVFIDVEWAEMTPIPLSVGLDSIFDLRHLESAAIQVGGCYPEEFWRDLVPFCGNNLKELAIHVRELTFRKLYHWQIFSQLRFVQHLYLYFSDGIQPDLDDPTSEALELEGDPEFQEFHRLVPPPSLKHLSLCFKWRPLPDKYDVDDFDIWMSWRLSAIDSAIAAHPERWRKLQQVDLQVIFHHDDAEQMAKLQLEVEEDQVNTLTSRGVVVLALQNKVTRTEWPYYFGASLGKVYGSGYW